MDRFLWNMLLVPIAGDAEVVFVVEAGLVEGEEGSLGLLLAGARAAIGHRQVLRGLPVLVRPFLLPLEGQNGGLLLVAEVHLFLEQL